MQFRYVGHGPMRCEAFTQELYFGCKVELTGDLLCIARNPKGLFIPETMWEDLDISEQEVEAFGPPSNRLNAPVEFSVKMSAAMNARNSFVAQFKPETGDCGCPQA